MTNTTRSPLARFLSDYSMVLVLLALCAYYSYATLADQHPGGAAGGERVAEDVIRVVKQKNGGRVLIIVRKTKDDEAFEAALRSRLDTSLISAETVRGHPSDARRAIASLDSWEDRVDEHTIVAIAAPHAVASWSVLRDQKKVPVLSPPAYLWPNFLKTDNLLNIANQIAVIAIIAVGMTMVVITSGIDLSVGSLIALAAVTATLLIRDAAGADQASAGGMVLCSCAAIALCGLVGLASGTLVTAFALPPFIVTLAMMLVASGLAFIVAQGQSIYQVPDDFMWLGRGADLAGLPNAVLLMLLLYAVAHVVMTRMRFGRYLYAVGGNAEAARLSGVPVQRVLLLAYTISGLLAGLGGIVMASQLKSGAPTYGQMYELYVIAAVVVGGTSLRGGEGKVVGTLIGALLIAVIQNGMNLTGVESYTQKVVLGLVILGAVLLDTLKHRSWRIPKMFRRGRTVSPPPAAEVGADRRAGPERPQVRLGDPDLPDERIRL
jgi:ribose transport system permease protein